MRTHFSNQSWLSEIRCRDIDNVWTSMSYFMWETSVDAMMSVGVPTDQDVLEWIIVLQHREDAATDTVQSCIKDCQDFIKQSPS